MEIYYFMKNSQTHNEHKIHYYKENVNYYI